MSQTVTKSKSMLSEELGVNQVMEAAGLRVVETDLGEYIIQLNNETPSHIVAPVMHKDQSRYPRYLRAGIGHDTDQ